MVFLALSSSLVAQSFDPVEVASTYLQAEKENLGLTDADISDFIVTDHYQTRHNGVTHLYIKQQYEGIEVEHAINNFNILKEGAVSSMGNRFVTDLASKVNGIIININPEDAVWAVVQNFEIATASSLIRQEMLSEQHIKFFKEGFALEPIDVKLMYQAVNENELRLSWRVSIYELSAQHWWVAYVDAQNGTILKYRDEVIHCDFGVSRGSV